MWICFYVTVQLICMNFARKKINLLIDGFKEIFLLRKYKYIYAEGFICDIINVFWDMAGSLLISAW